MWICVSYYYCYCAHRFIDNSYATCDESTTFATGTVLMPKWSTLNTQYHTCFVFFPSMNKLHVSGHLFGCVLVTGAPHHGQRGVGLPIFALVLVLGAAAGRLPIGWCIRGKYTYILDAYILPIGDMICCRHFFAPVLVLGTSAGHRAASIRLVHSPSLLSALFCPCFGTGDLCGVQGGRGGGECTNLLGAPVPKQGGKTRAPQVPKGGNVLKTFTLHQSTVLYS